MPTDLQATIVADIAARLDAWLTAAGVTEPAQLAPATVKGPDLALPCHRWARAFRKSPQAIAQDAAALVLEHPLVAAAEALNGFLNITLDWVAVGERVVDWANTDAGALGESEVLAGQKIIIEYSSPNTNKPQHLGHCRNNLLGQTVSALLAAAGGDVTRLNLVNDRGIHICKSMVAYRRFGQGVTPESTGTKGDHLVGDFYVRFDQAFSEEYKAAFPDGEGPPKEEFFNTASSLGAEARQMLLDWEAGDPEVRALWTLMNGWCEAGFAQTYARMGVSFDLIDKESQTYVLGRTTVEAGLEAGVFHRLDNGAVAFDQAKMGLEGDKVVLRADGTSLYVTQDIGTAIMRHDRHRFDRAIYVVGSEQDHYFRVLFGILAQLRPELDGHLFHRSYGMVELPEGKMKSREGTVVDADDLMDDLRDMALAASAERWAHLDEAARRERAEAIGLGGLKFFLLKFNPRTGFVFDKENSISIEGETGPYCQYAHARACSLLAKLGDTVDGVAPDWTALDNEPTRALMQALLAVPTATRRAAEELDPSNLTRATFEVSKAFASFYNNDECRVIGAEPGAAAARAALVRATRRVLAALLGRMGVVALEEM